MSVSSLSLSLSLSLSVSLSLSLFLTAIYPKLINKDALKGREKERAFTVGSYGCSKSDVKCIVKIPILLKGWSCVGRDMGAGASCHSSFYLFLILILKLVPLTLELARTLNMFIRLQVMLLRAI